MKNGSETDIDCGGSCTTKCADTAGCAIAGDCKSDVCTGSKCVAATCDDLVRNGTESDVDCGGACPNRCAEAKVCRLGSDCRSGVCSGGRCAAPSCTDGVKNASETDIDCGGSCTARCADTKRCSMPEDCVNSICLTGTCRSPMAVKALPGNGNTCVLSSTGKVKCWGNNADGGLGLGDTVDRLLPGPSVDFGAGRTVKDLAFSVAFGCAILDNDELKCWGYNGWGQLGFATPVFTSAPTASVVFPAGRTPKTVSVSGNHTCVILDDASLWCWGYNAYGALGLGNNTHTSGPTAAVNLGPGRTAKAVQTSGGGTCAILDDDTLKCWGQNGYGQHGFGDGVDTNAPGPIANFGPGRTVKMVAMGGYDTCAILDDASLRCWGNNGLGQCGVGNTAYVPAPTVVNLGAGRTAKSISMNGFVACAILDDDTMKCWGAPGTVGNGSNVPYNAPGPVIDFGPGRTVRFMTAMNHSCAVLDNFTVKCWGINPSGGLGTGDTLNYYAPPINPVPIAF